MKLVRDDSRGAHDVRVPCYVCGRMAYLSDCQIDIDGPAYQAYYCPSHWPEGAAR